MNIDELKQRLYQVEKNIDDSMNACGRKTPVSYIAVSKKKPLQSIQDLHTLGHRDFGENYVREALEKIQALSEFPDIIWHFIGSIQSNKTKDIAQNFHWVHSIDRLKTASRLNDQRPNNLPPLQVCLEVNICKESTKSGVSIENITDLALAITKMPNLILRGLMTMPPIKTNPEEQKIPFSQTKELLQKINKDLHISMDTLSMGTSADFPTAITEGATYIRLGTSLFGPREYSDNSL